MAYESLDQGEEFLRAVAERNRLRILRLLLVGGESCVCELIDALDLPQYTVSRNLAILRHAGVVDERRDGAWRYYSIPARPTEGLSGRLLDAIQHGLGEELLETDLTLFKRRLALRVDGKCVVSANGTCCCTDAPSDR